MRWPQIHVHFYSSDEVRGTDPGCIRLLIWLLPANTSEKYRLKENYFYSCGCYNLTERDTCIFLSCAVRNREGCSAYREQNQVKNMHLGLGP